MTTDVVCPICRGGVLSRADGKLEQSGDSFLPTVVWSCARCEYARYEPATHARWRPAQADAALRGGPTPSASPRPAEEAGTAETAARRAA